MTGSLDFSQHFQYFVLGIILFIAGCATPDPEFWPPVSGTPTKEIYVSLDTWHAMIGFNQRDLQNHNQFSETLQSQALLSQQHSFEEWGFAERAWYLEGRQGISGVLRALFWPTEGVVEIAEYDQVWAKRTPQPPSDLFKFRVSQQGYQRLRTHLRSTSASSNLVETVRGSRFYQATRSYHLFHHCHQYVAQALKEAGLPISIFWSFSRTTLATQLQQAEALANQGNSGGMGEKDLAGIP